MKRGLQYYIIELKKMLWMLYKSCGSMMLLLMGAGVLCVIVTLFSVKTKEPVKVALVTLDQNEQIISLASLLVENTFLSQICEVEYVDSKEDPEGLIESARYEMVVRIPENFVESVDSGENSPAEVFYASELDEMGQAFKSLFHDGVTLIDVVEAVIYTVETYEEEELLIGRTELENLLMDDTLEKVLNRKKLFLEKKVSAMGTMNQQQYFMITLVLLMVLFFSCQCSVLYEEEEYRIQGQFMHYGMNMPMIEFIKCMALTSIFFLLQGLCMVVQIIILYCLGKQMPAVSILTWGILFLVSFAEACYVHCVFTVVRDKHYAQVMLFILNLGMLVCSGGIFPIALFQKSVWLLCKSLPFYSWFQVLSSVCWERISIDSLITMIIYAILLWILGEVVEWRRKSHGF